MCCGKLTLYVLHIQVSTNAEAAATPPYDGNTGDGSGGWWEESANNCSSTNELLLLFQKLLLGNLYSSSFSCFPSATACPPSPISPHPEPSSPVPPPTSPSLDHTHQHAQGAISVLVKYVSLLHGHITQVLEEASEHPRHFLSVSKVLKGGPVEALLPGLAVGLVLLQLRLPTLMVESQCLELMGKLMEGLDKFNRLAPSTFREDSADLDWPGCSKCVITALVG